MKINVITGINLIELDEVFGAKSIYSYPKLSNEIITHVSIKTITLLAAEQGFIPKSLVIIPFPRLNLKGMIKYIEFKDKNRRGGVEQLAITLIFKEIDDLIFYKYKKNFESVFNDTARKLGSLKEIKADKKAIKNEIKKLYENLINILEDMRMVECSELESEAFSEIQKTVKTKNRFKILIIGDGEVGKTSIVLKFTKNAFKRTYLPTLGVNICEKTIRVNKSTVQLVLWDIAGQAKFIQQRKHFYHGAHGMVLVFDQTNLESFYGIYNWYQDILREDIQLPGCLLGNKDDLNAEKKIKKENAIKLANKLNFEYFETSALTGKDLELPFYKLAKYLIKLKKSNPQT